MKSKVLRIAIPLAVIVLVTVGFVSHAGIGTVSALGWRDVSLLCPLGALSTMLASKLVVPRAVVSLLIALVLIILLGRAFCAWVCPVPVVSRLRDLFKPKRTRLAQKKQHECASCSEKRPSSSRHFVLGGALLSAAVFGFPVFCLICPVGLTFATVLLVLRLFVGGDVTWAVIAVPALLLIEVVFFRRWCHDFCPLGALMSLVGKLNRSFRPTVDDNTCIEATKGATCGACAKACGEGIDPHHPQVGASLSECTKCRACVDACPAHAISMPLLPAKKKAEVLEAAGENHEQSA